VGNRVRKWAVFVYFAADVPSGNMRSAARRNLHQLAKLGSSASVYVAAQMDLTGEPTRRFRFPDGGKGEESGFLEPSAILENVNSASEASLYSFLEWAIKECPAERVALVLWGHGYGIDDFNPILVNGPEATFSNQPERAGRDQAPALAVQNERQPASNAVTPVHHRHSRLFAMLFDATSRSGLKNHELADVLRRFNNAFLGGNKIAILGFDCCEMAMAEVWCEMTGCAQILIASQTGVPYSSWPYDNFLQLLEDAHEASSNEISSRIVRAFADHYSKADRTPLVTFSACQLNDSSDVERAVHRLASSLEMSAAEEDGRALIFSARNKSPIYDADGFVDAIHRIGMWHPAQDPCGNHWTASFSHQLSRRTPQRR